MTVSKSILSLGVRVVSPVHGGLKYVMAMIGWVMFVSGMQVGAERATDPEDSVANAIAEIRAIDQSFQTELANSTAPDWYIDAIWVFMNRLIDVMLWVAIRGVEMGAAAPDVVGAVGPLWKAPPIIMGAAYLLRLKRRLNLPTP